MLQFSLLGAPKLLRNGNPVSGFITRKAEALLYYLIVTERAHTRSAVAALLWPDMPEQNARKNLRDVIASLRKTVGDLLLISHQTLTLNPEYPYWADVAVVSKVLSDPKGAALNELREAIGLYHGEFLEGFFVLNATPFDEWARQKREEYHIFVLNGLHILADRYLAANELDAGLTATRRLLLLDPWNEQAHCKQMWLLACAGQRTAALAQYQTCVQVLADELHLEPMPETTALYRQIRDGIFNQRQPVNQETGRGSQGSRVHTPASSADVPPLLRPHNLPRQLTPLIDRFHESGALRNKLQDLNYPLITLVGEGGVGKTRLAIAVAQSIVDGVAPPAPRRSSLRSTGLLGGAPATNPPWSQQSLFQDGVWFVPLAHLMPSENVPEQLATAIGMALGLAFSGNRAPKTQLLEWLANKHLLLVLDNFEHFSAGVGFVIELLQSVHNLKLLVTSRHRLNLQAEYVYRLEGLAIPETAEGGTWNSATLLDYGSVQLFLERAGRTTPGFVLTAENQQKVLTICRFVEGLPLGIELAAALVEHNDIAVIAQALTANYALLAADLADLSPRHHSISTVLDYSWQLLATDEAEILAQCSIFQGGFTLDAVTAITSATIAQLESLVHQSLLRHAEGGRFEMHELVRHYTAERLTATAALKATLTKRYCTYYVDLLYTNQEQLPDNRLIAAAMRQELGNLRATWTYASAAADAYFVAKGLDGFVRCYEMAGLYKEGEALLGQTVNHFEAQTFDGPVPPEWRHLLARLWLEQGLFCLRLGYLDVAATLYQRAQEVGRQLNDAFLLAYAQYRISLLLLMRGNYKAALTTGQEALAWAQQTGFLALQGNILSNIGLAYEHSGNKAQARTALLQALQLTQQHGSKEAEALLLINLGELHQKTGNFAEALHCHQQALFLLRRIDKQQGIALVLHYLGSLLIAMGGFVEARTHLEQALAIFQQSGDRYYVELILTRLSNLFYQLALYEKAQAFSEQAVHLAAGTGHQSILAEALLYAGRIWAAQQQPAQAAAAYQQALTLWQESGQADWVMTTKAELAWLAYTEQDYAGALHLVEQVLGQQTTEILNFTSDPFQVAWLCYKVLLVNGDPRAPAVLADAHRQLLTQAATIHDEALRQSFLEKVAANRAILEASQT